MCPGTGVPWTRTVRVFLLYTMKCVVHEDLLRSTSGVHARHQNNPSSGRVQVASDPARFWPSDHCLHGRQGQRNTIGDDKFSQVDETNFHPGTASTPTATRTSWTCGNDDGERAEKDEGEGFVRPSRFIRQIFFRLVMHVLVKIFVIVKSLLVACASLWSRLIPFARIDSIVISHHHQVTAGFAGMNRESRSGWDYRFASRPDTTLGAANSFNSRLMASLRCTRGDCTYHAINMGDLMTIIREIEWLSGHAALFNLERLPWYRA